MKNKKPVKVKPPGRNGPSDESDKNGQTQWKALTLDVDYYQAFMDDTAIPEDQKREMIETLWSIIVAFVDLGFGIHPAKQAVNAKQNRATAIIEQFAAKAETRPQTEKENFEERIDA
ncbi:hypothetical protein FIV00_00045 [Labrenzia sp. THAF82]|nr:hypothetical protein FIV00_00045 [Labrenzia sp. THAF82]